MIRHSKDLGRQARAAFDSIIDVRSQAEFAEDHIPGAINLPVLDNAERIEIGTLYVQTSKFLARRLGAAKVARNIANHLDTALADKTGSFRPLVYCWRGGQRSGAMAAVMDQIGWPVIQLEGGYQSWRRAVVARLYSASTEAAVPKIILLDGRTGCGKTEILKSLAGLGVQTLDLEAMAQHRGSLFGATTMPQPSQKRFESQLYEALETLDFAKPIVVEAESSRIGNLTLPPMLWAAMQTAPRITLSASLQSRARHILDVYRDIATDKAALDEALTRLPRHHSRETISRWRDFAREGNALNLAEEMMQAHYDPAYDRHAARNEEGKLANFAVDLSAQGIAEAARKIADAVEQLARRSNP